VFDDLINILPCPRQKRYGRKRCEFEAILNGILQVLVNGVAWRKIAPCGCSYATCFRYFKEIQRRGKLKLILRKISEVKTDITEGYVDTTTASSYEFRYCTGWDGHNKKVGTKVSLFTDKSGLPADIAFGKGSVDDKSMLPKHIENTKGMMKKTISLDMKYMSLKLRRDMRKKGIRINMKVREQDYTRKKGPKFRFDEEIYNRRFELERTNGWLKAFRSLVLRRTYHIASFKAFVYLAIIIILLRS
jgi:transposase